MSDKIFGHCDGDSGSGAVGGERSGRPERLSLGISGNDTGVFVIPTDPGDGRDDGAKFRDLVWVPDDEKVLYQGRTFVEERGVCDLYPLAPEKNISLNSLLSRPAQVIYECF